MNLREAVRHAERMVSDGTLKGRDAIAIYCLLDICKKALRLQKPIRQLERALCPQEELNQVSLFEDTDDG